MRIFNAPKTPNGLLFLQKWGSVRQILDSKALKVDGPAEVYGLKSDWIWSLVENFWSHLKELRSDLNWMVIDWSHKKAFKPSKLTVMIHDSWIMVVRTGPKIQTGPDTTLIPSNLSILSWFQIFLCYLLITKMNDQIEIRRSNESPTLKQNKTVNQSRRSINKSDLVSLLPVF